MDKTSAWVTGYHAVLAVLTENPSRAIQLYYVPGNNPRQQEVLQLAEELSLPQHKTDKQTLNQQLNTSHHQGVALKTKPRQIGNEKELKTWLQDLPSTPAPLLLVLDQVQDPYNFGACVRTASAAGVNAIIYPKDNTSPATTVAQKAASGAMETMTLFRVTNLARSLQLLQQHGIWLLGTSDKAEQSLYQQHLTDAIALVMGGEGKGLRPLTQKQCDIMVKLPMGEGLINSLNVSVATGVCLYEAVRQRQVNNAK